MVILPLKIVI